MSALGHSLGVPQKVTENYSVTQKVDPRRTASVCARVCTISWAQMFIAVLFIMTNNENQGI